MPTMRQPQTLLGCWGVGIFSYGVLYCRFFMSELIHQIQMASFELVTPATQAVHRAEQAYGEVRREIERRHTV